MNVSANLSVVQNAPGYNSWSFVQELGGSLVCAYSRGREHSITESCRGAFARRSDDGGQSWLPETTVVNSDTECECAAGKGLDEDGAMLLWVRCAKADGSRRHDLYRSPDGRSFERLASPALDPSPMQVLDIHFVPGVGLMSLWFAGEYRDLPENSWGMLVSRDNGRSWKQIPVETELRRDDWPTEPSCIVLPDGRIFAISRIDNFGGDIPHNCQFQLQSEDSGKTWRKFRTNIDDVNLSTPSLLFDSASGVVSNYYFHRGTGFLKRRSALLEAVWDNPGAWPEPDVICQASALFQHAGNVNTCRFKERHACTVYSGTERQTDILLALTDAPARPRR